MHIKTKAICVEYELHCAQVVRSCVFHQVTKADESSAVLVTWILVEYWRWGTCPLPGYVPDDVSPVSAFLQYYAPDCSVMLTFCILCQILFLHKNIGNSRSGGGQFPPFSENFPQILLFYNCRLPHLCITVAILFHLLIHTIRWNKKMIIWIVSWMKSYKFPSSNVGQGSQCHPVGLSHLLDEKMHRKFNYHFHKIIWNSRWEFEEAQFLRISKWEFPVSQSAHSAVIVCK